MAVSTNIKRLREHSNMTQSELADTLGVARSTVTQWENGWSSPRMGMVQKLAGVFRVTTAEIVADQPTVQSDKADLALNRLVENYSHLPAEWKAALVKMSDTMLDCSRGES